MRMLRWASELAVEANGGRSGVGVATLGALEDSELLQVEDQSLVSAVLAAVVENLVTRYDGTKIVEEAD
ncbi:MAG TPA: hypothetical protein VFJ19_09740 [Nocardioidaceae bacterium]|nr:hypothetical protein [Nocardioidaceae bacterium]